MHKFYLIYGKQIEKTQTLFTELVKLEIAEI